MRTKTAISIKIPNDSFSFIMKKTMGSIQDNNNGPSSAKNTNSADTVWLKSINHITDVACKGKTSSEIFRLVGEELGKMGISTGFFIKEPGTETLTASNVALSSGDTAAYPADFRGHQQFSISTQDSEIINRVLSTGEMVLSIAPDNLQQLFPALPGDAGLPEAPLSCLCAPLGNATGVFGVLVAVSLTINEDTARNISLLAHIASMSHSTSRLITDVDEMRQKIECLDKGFGSAVSALDKSLQDVVYALTVPMEMRDPYTSGHQKRVTRLAVAIAEEMGVAQYHIDGLKLASSIHDIGKIVVPFEILNRPTRLTEAEFNLIKMHPQIAFEMLSPISFRWPVAEIVRQHHERANGSGYPRGLKSGEMLLESKILAIADVVEAMSSHRPYRASLGIDAALEEVSSRSGVTYDPEAVAACIRLLLIKNFSLETGLPSPAQNFSPFAIPKG